MMLAIVADDLGGDLIAYRAGKIAIFPEFPTPETPLDPWELSKDGSSTQALEPGHDLDDGIAGREGAKMWTGSGLTSLSSMVMSYGSAISAKSSLWRQRRLVMAETTAIAANRNSLYIAQDVNEARGISRYSSNAIHIHDLKPFDPKQESGCRQVISEYERLPDLANIDLAQQAPLIHEQAWSEGGS
jgi:hypothetical protein